MKKLLLSLFALSISGIATSQEWIEQDTNLFGGSRGVKFDIVNANVVWAIGYDGVAVPVGQTANVVQELTRTIDGGDTWIASSIEIGDPDLSLTNISAIDANTAFIGAVYPEDGFGGVYKTTDGGESWENSNPNAYSTDGNTTGLTSFFNVVHFFDANNGLTEGDPIGAGNGEYEIYKTTDGGDTWTAIPGSAIPDPSEEEYGYNGGNIAAGNSFWFVTNKGKIYRTTDMGTTWTSYQTPITDFGSATISGDLRFSDDNNGLLMGASTVGTGNNAVTTYTLYRTFDGGATWDAGTPYTSPYTSVNYIPGTLTLVGTGATDVAYTSGYSNDNGATWTEIDNGVQRTSIMFIDGSTGWAGGFTSAELTGGIYKFSGTLAVKNATAATKITATPNPTTGVVQISNENSSISEVAAFDILGKQVYNAKFSQLSNVNIDLSSLNSGAYILRITDANGANQTVKVLKN